MSIPFYNLNRITTEDKNFLTKGNKVLETTGVGIDIDYLERKLNCIADIREKALLLDRIGKATNAVEHYTDIRQEVVGAVIKAKESRLDIAFLGIVNAGKSTIQNALFGIAIAPKRNSPATSIPTAFVYKPELKEPRLEIPEPLLELSLERLEQLRRLIREKGLENITEQLGKHTESKEIMPDIISGNFDKYLTNIPTISEEIYNYLTKLNDFYRICWMLGIGQPPVEHYPVVYTPFYGITENIDGSLFLFDTPGPNEGAPVGKDSSYDKLLETILKLTQRTILVADYTQPETIASDNVIDICKKVIQIQGPDSLLVLVNKIDQRDSSSNDRTEEEVQSRFETELGIKPSQIIEVSAFEALRSSTTRRDLDNCSLPLQEIPSVKELAKIASPLTPEQWLETVTREIIQEAAELTWKKSGFETFINKMRALIKNTEYETLKSAITIAKSSLDKALEDIQQAKDQLNKDKNSTEKSVIRLEQEIEQLKNSQKTILNQWLTSLVENNQTLLFSNFKSKDFDNKKDADSYLAESIAKILDNFSKIWDDNLPSLIKNLQIEQNKLIQLTKAAGLELQFISVEGKLPQPTFSFKNLDPECKQQPDKVLVKTPIFEEQPIYDSIPNPTRRTRHSEPPYDTTYTRVLKGYKKVFVREDITLQDVFKTIYCITDLHKYQIFNQIKNQIRDFINSKDTIASLSLDGLREQLEAHKLTLEKRFKSNLDNLNVLQIETQEAINLLTAHQQRLLSK
jgi:GTP-binding protein EngB required for normal cell division